MPFDTLANTAAANLREHISYEQNIVWPKLRLRLSDEEACRLGDELDRARQTRPPGPTGMSRRTRACSGRPARPWPCWTGRAMPSSGAWSDHTLMDYQTISMSDVFWAGGGLPACG